MKNPPKTFSIGAVSEVSRVAVFYNRSKFWSPKTKDHGKIVENFVAVDLTRYHVTQGKTMSDAVLGLATMMKYTQLLIDEQIKKGGKVIKNKIYRKPDVQKDLRKYEEQARKYGCIIEPFRWLEWVKRLEFKPVDVKKEA